VKYYPLWPPLAIVSCVFTQTFHDRAKKLKLWLMLPEAAYFVAKEMRLSASSDAEDSSAIADSRTALCDRPAGSGIFLIQPLSTIWVKASFC